MRLGSLLPNSSLHQKEFWGFCSKECFDADDEETAEKLMQAEVEVNPEVCLLPAGTLVQYLSFRCGQTLKASLLI